MRCIFHWTVIQLSRIINHYECESIVIYHQYHDKTPFHYQFSIKLWVRALYFVRVLLLLCSNDYTLLYLRCEWQGKRNISFGVYKSRYSYNIWILFVIGWTRGNMWYIQHIHTVIHSHSPSRTQNKLNIFRITFFRVIL